MQDDRENIFGLIRHGLRGFEKLTAKRSNRSPLKTAIDHDFQSLFNKFYSELKVLGGDAVVLAGWEGISKFVIEKTTSDENIFVYPGASQNYESTVSEIQKHRAIRTSSEFDGNKHEASLFGTAISTCVACIAETGTVAIEGKLRLPAALASKLFIIADTDKLIPSLDELFTDEFRDFVGSNLFLITGPSRTADIEKELVTGVHGPKEVCVIFVQH